MATSGITVSDAALSSYEEFKLRRGDKSRYIVYKIEGTEVVIETRGGVDASYEEFTKALPDAECRFAVFDYEYEADGRQQDKVVFVAWSPDSASIKNKMVYSSTKAELERNFTGLAVKLQATDRDEASEESLRRTLGL